MDIIRVQILIDTQSERNKVIDKLKNIEYLRFEKPIAISGTFKDSFAGDLSDVVLVAEKYLNDGYRATEMITADFPDKAVILLDQDNDMDVRRAVTSGASDVLDINCDPEDLNDAIYRVFNSSRSRQEKLKEGKEHIAAKEGKIITVFSTKGGTGKTFLSTNLALTLLKQTGKKVVLFDLDLDYGGDAIALNLPVKYSLANVINEIRNIDSDLMDSYLLTHESGLRVLAANPDPGFSEYVNQEHIDLILKTLQNSFDYIVIDMPGRFMQTVNPAFSLANSVLLVTTPEVIALKNIKSSLMLFKELNYPLNKIRIVLNKSSNSGVSKKDVESSLGHEVYSEIEEDIKGVRKSQNEGNAYVDMFPRSKTTATISKLAASLSGGEAEPPKKWRWGK